MGWNRKSWLRYRVIIYAVVAVAVFVWRNQFDWSRLTGPLRGGDAGADSLVVAGRDLATGLVDDLVAHYHRDYPRLAIVTVGGGTNQALEDLLNGRADAAFLSRRPTPAEQDLFRQVDGDTAIVVGVGIGGILVLAGTEAPSPGPVRLTTSQFRDLMDGRTGRLCDRLYAADPNRGSWAAAAHVLGRKSDPVDTTTVIYLADDREVVRAVTNDPRAFGLIVSYDLPDSNAAFWPGPAGPAGPRVASLTSPATGRSVTPSYENVATGDYGLFAPLLIACRGRGGIQGGKFVTHLASARGQRQVERAGCIPARQILREIILTNETPTREKES